jgi:hypothetical protein
MGAVDAAIVQHISANLESQVLPTFLPRSTILSVAASLSADDDCFHVMPQSHSADQAKQVKQAALDIAKVCTRQAMRTFTVESYTDHVLQLIP